MEFDQSFMSTPADWNFPSPTTTPTDGSFGANGFQTPKAATFQSHFHDAFLTPQMPNYGTPLQRPWTSTTTAQRPQTSSDTLRSNYMANIQASGVQGAGQGMPPPGQGFNMVSPVYGGAHAASMQLAMNTSFDPTQMQTPPPTRGTSARKVQAAQQVAFGTPSTIASRRIMTPQHPVGPAGAEPGVHQSPMHFPQLQFSPDVYQFAHMGPASAPAMPHSRVLWDSSSPMLPIPAPHDDPFAPASTSFMAWPAPPSQHNSIQNVPFDTPSMGSYSVQTPHVRPATAIPASFSTTHSGVHQLTTVGVDPSLLYSSPRVAISRSNSRSKDRRAQPSKVGEKQMTRRVTNHARSDTASSGDTVTNAATTTVPPQRKSLTTVPRSRSGLPTSNALESLSRSTSLDLIPRTDPPVKRLGKSALGSVSEGKQRQRRSVILTIDDNGRATTETTQVGQGTPRSIRERYPALYDSESSESESDQSNKTPSRTSSFIFDQQDERRSKAARLDPPIEDLAGLTIPRSNSSASMRKGIPPSRAAVAAAAQLRRQGSLRRSSSIRNGQPKKALTSSTSASTIDTCPMDGLPEDPPSKEHDRSLVWQPQSTNFLSPPTGAERALAGYNRRWSIMSFEQQQQQQHQQQHQQQQHHQQQQQQPPPPSNMPPQEPYFQPNPNPCPDAQIQTPHYPLQPPPQHQQYQQLLIRCQCGIPDDRGQPLLQCRSCTQWLHAACVSAAAGHDAAVQGVFTCFLCTRPPSSRAVSKGAMFSAG